MEKSSKIAVFTNAVLLFLVAAVGVICFFPFGASPAGNISDRVYYGGSGENGRVSLMFNVYGGEEYLPQIFDTLDGFEVKATFFVGGCWADDHTESVREIVSRGHELGNHGYFHKDQDKLSLAANRQEISLCGDLVRSLTDVTMTLFAPPSGAYSENTVSAAEALGYKVIMWSKDTIDWRDHDVSVIYRRATEDAEAGDLVLMHPTKETAEALPSVLAYYKEQGLLQSTVSATLGF